jgi:bacillolysin
LSALERFEFHVADQPRAEVESEPRFRGLRTFEAEAEPQAVGGGGAEAAGEELGSVDAGFNSDESAARHYLSEILTEVDTPAAAAITAPDRPEVVPNLQFAGVQEQPGTESRLVRFEQTEQSIPVFGGHAVCELTSDRGLVSASGEVGSVHKVSTLATLSQADALATLAEHLGVAVEAIGAGEPPELQLFPGGGEDDWHLVWLFREIPATPKDVEIEPHGHGLGRSPRDVEPLFDYLVDAHDGALVYYYSAAPMLMEPTYGSGENEDGVAVQFFGRMVGTAFELRDPMRKVVTYDLQLGDIQATPPSSPIQGASVHLGASMKAAVSAHTNASIVDDFYRGVLQRDGIDDKGMELVNVVNCTYAKGGEAAPVWSNAVWWGNRMWYGQAPDANGVTRSYSRLLDVIAHELTHGVTAFTAGLVYRDQSGALSESYSDILAIIVKNWDRANPTTGGDVSGWDWQLGPGLRPGGKPLRDLSDPSVTGHPAHMDHYLQTTQDSGGVHTNSNIHNKAAYNVLTATQSGARAFTPREGALLFYLGLTRLGKLSSFKDSLAAVTAVAGRLWEGTPQLRDEKVAAIRAAYADVGIA